MIVSFMKGIVSHYISDLRLDLPVGCDAGKSKRDNKKTKSLFSFSYAVEIKKGFVGSVYII